MSGGLVIKAGDALLSHGFMPHYHQRKEVSLLSSGRDQVVHSCYCRQQTVMVFCFGFYVVIIFDICYDLTFHQIE